MDLVQKIILAMSTSYLRQERYCQPLAAITYIAIFFEKKLNSSIPLYICAAVDLFGLVLTAQVAIKKDIHKYLSKEDTAK